VLLCDPSLPTEVVPVAPVIMYLMAPLWVLIGVAVLYLYRHSESLKEEYSYVYYGLIGLVIGVVPVSLVTVTGTVTDIRFLLALWVAFIGLAVLYMYRYGGGLRDEYPYVYYGLVAVIGCAALLLYALFIFTVMLLSVSESGEGLAGVAIDQNPGVVEITMVDNGNLDSWGLVGPDGTRSTMAPFEVGTTIRLRSNEKVISYLNSPENNITVLTTSGTKTVENVGELPSEYQKAPDGLIDPDADIGNYDNASVATAACLVTHDGVKVGEKSVPANVTLPCSTPVLAQEDSVTPGTSVESTSGSSAGKTLTSPITYSEEDEYSVVGTEDGSEKVVSSFTIEDFGESAGGG